MLWTFEVYEMYDVSGGNHFLSLLKHSQCMGACTQPQHKMLVDKIGDWELWLAIMALTSLLNQCYSAALGVLHHQTRL